MDKKHRQRSVVGDSRKLDRRSPRSGSQLSGSGLRIQFVGALVRVSRVCLMATTIRRARQLRGERATIVFDAPDGRTRVIRRTGRQLLRLEEFVRARMLAPFPQHEEPQRERGGAEAHDGCGGDAAYGFRGDAAVGCWLGVADIGGRGASRVRRGCSCTAGGSGSVWRS